MIADAVKHLTHTLLMLPVLHSQVGGLPGQGVMTSALKSLLASLATGAAAWLAAGAVTGLVGFETLSERLLVVAVAGLAGVAVYALLGRLLDIREARTLRRLLRR